jgi:hypothetical protein
MTNLGIGLIGYAFMGAAHSQAWRSAPRFFDLPLNPEMNVLCGRDRGGQARLEGNRDRLAQAARPRRHPAGRRLHTGGQPRRDRHRRPRGR